MSTDSKENNINIRIMTSRHSAFFSPLLIAVKSSFSNNSPIECTYSVADNKDDIHKLLIDNQIDIALSAVSLSWRKSFNRELINFAQINRMDGFFLLRRNNISKSNEFNWSDLVSKSIIIDQEFDSSTTFKYALFKNDIALNDVVLINSGSSENMINEFKSGEGDYIHLQGPDIHQLVNDGYGDIVTSVGKTIGPLSFNSLICKNSFIDSNNYLSFINLLNESKIFTINNKPEIVAEIVLDFFPDIELDVLINTIISYQKLNCWESNLNITENHYDNTLQIFQHYGLKGIYPYSEFVNNGDS